MEASLCVLMIKDGDGRDCVVQSGSGGGQRRKPSPRPPKDSQQKRSHRKTNTWVGYP